MTRLLLLALLAMCALAQPPLEQAVQLTRQKQYAEARKLLDGVSEPSDPARRIALHRLKAAIASGLGEGATAADEMSSALKLAPGDPSLLLGTAVAELQAGRLDTALEHARTAGESATGEALIGDIQEKRGEFLKAANAYREAVRLAPDREQYRIALALEFVQHRSFRQAITVLEPAALAFPRSARIRALLGVMQYATEDIEGAISWLTEAITIDPNLEPAHVYLARIVLGSSTAPSARTVASLCGWDPIVCGALKLRQAREKNDPALLAEAMLALQHAPAKNAIARCELGRAYEWTRRWPEARVEMEACIGLDPSPANHYRLGLIYQKLGLADLARHQMELRNQALQKLSDETARRVNAVEAFR